MTVQVDRRLEQTALLLAERGYHVFPCHPGRKEPLTQRGFKDATRNEQKILQWWDSHPTANIGIACQASGIAVLDIDAKHGANPTDLIDGWQLNGAPMVLTGKAPARDHQHPRSLPGVRGAQIYFRGALPTGDLSVAGCEIRGTGAYVIAPGSLHPSGVAYTGQLPPIDQLPDIPEWLQELAAARARNGQAPAAPVAETIPKGQQHRALVSLAGSMRRRGMDADEIEAALQVTNQKRLEDPATPENVKRIAQSVARYPPAEAVDRARAHAPMPADAAAASHALTELLALDQVGVTIRQARVYGKGSGASVEIELSNNETMTFAALRDMLRPQTLIAEVAACAMTRPTLKQPQCAEALVLTKTLAKYVPTDSENDIALEWGRDYLELAETIDLDITDQAQRWRGFEMLKERNPSTDTRDAAQIATAGLVLRHTDNTRFVRTLWFERYVRTRDAGVSRVAVGARMARVGWHRRGKHGDIKATAPGRNQTAIYPFWVVPGDWDDEREGTEWAA